HEARVASPIRGIQHASFFKSLGTSPVLGTTCPFAISPGSSGPLLLLLPCWRCSLSHSSPETSSTISRPAFGATGGRTTGAGARREALRSTTSPKGHCKDKSARNLGPKATASATYPSTEPLLDS